MSDFDQLVKEQMQLMDQLLDVQGELDLCLETEKQLQQDEKKKKSGIGFVIRSNRNVRNCKKSANLIYKTNRRGHQFI
ncbi:hypothetical protein BsIDN1_15990 [Bacillus safensis]|uniref:Uncharacterized protein n=1 Tax=Bacillus safensis TaxID=561879 RepID=A0A5S9M4W6_BACIA|nr:hypothetical protein BsIDN1_15990 [Bacillus safensis]